MTHHTYRNASDALPYLAADIMANGEKFSSRAGQTRELTNVHITLLRPWERAIITPGRKASLPAQIAETMWVLAGRSDVEWLSNYLPRAYDFSDDGITWRGAYGTRIRYWGFQSSPFRTTAIDQLKYVVDLLNEDRNTRRAIINIYDPATDSQPGKDIPCNNWLHFMIRNDKLDLTVTTRSNDLIWGWSGINAFEWSALQEIVAGLTGVAVGVLNFNISSLHIYDRHFQRATEMAKQGSAGNYSSLNGEDVPFDVLACGDLEDFDDLVKTWFGIEGLCRRKEFGAADEGIDYFPEPMMKSWLKVIRWYWSNTTTPYPSLRKSGGGLSPMEAAVIKTPTRTWEPKLEEPTEQSLPGAAALREEILSTDFYDHAIKLHEQKHLAYGNSWKRRGELLGVLANIARKVDRLGGSETDDETSADTALDLLIYLIKYRLWLIERQPQFAGPAWLSKDYGDPLSDLHAPVAEYLEHLKYQDAGGVMLNSGGIANTEGFLKSEFEELSSYAVADSDVMTERHQAVAVLNTMIAQANRLAYTLWQREQNSKRAWKGYEA